MERMFRPVGFLMLLFCTTNLQAEDLTCKNCQDLADPSYCRVFIICGKKQACFTEEYENHKGQQAFRLGCESEAICTLVMNAKTLFGKRSILDDDKTDHCYQCCSKSECNVALCSGSVSQTQTTLQPQHTTPQIAKPTCISTNGWTESFMPYGDHCYLFPIQCANWSNASNYCQKQDAMLLSINSKEENDFLVKEMKKLNDTHNDVFWTGGIYSHAARRWEWLDGSPFSYTNWLPGYPPSTYSPINNYYIFLGNPAYQAYYANGEMYSYPAGSVCRRFVCKRPQTF